MSTISMFFGILIRMYLDKKDHNPPHIHSYYQNKKATFDIKLVIKLMENYHKTKKNLFLPGLFYIKKNY